MSTTVALKRPAKTGALALTALVIVSLATFAGLRWFESRPARFGAGLPGDLAALALPRGMAPRLSFGPVHRACPDTAPREGTVARGACAPEPGVHERLLGFAGHPAGADTASSPERDHALALADLATFNGRAEALDGLVSRLRAAAARVQKPAPVLGDLAAAYLVRAEVRQNPLDLHEAVEAAARALEADPADPTARFNLALALERMGLDVQAARAWRASAALDPASPWGVEAATRARALAPPPAPVPPDDADTAALARFAAAAPLEARMHGWETLLGQWGQAVGAGDEAGAARKLAAAEALGRALEARGGDASLADAVRAIRAAGGPDRAALARGHKGYADTQRAWAEGQYGQMEAPLAHARAAAGRSPALDAWSGIAQAVSWGYASRIADAEAETERVERLAAPRQWGDVAGRALWTRGSVALRASRPADAIPHFRAAEARFAALGEPEAVGAMQALRGDAETQMGNTRAAAASVHRGMGSLRRYRSSRWLHNALLVSIRHASYAGLVRAAGHLHAEDMEVTASLPAVYALEARLTRARALGANGDISGARAEAGAASATTEEQQDRILGWLRKDAAYTRALLEPGVPEAELSDLITFFDRDIRPRVPALLSVRARVRLESGNLKGATADVEEMVRRLAGWRDTTSAAGLVIRSEVRLAGGRELVDALAMRHLADGNQEVALRLLTRGRAALAGLPIDAGGGMPARRPDEVALRLALVGDTLLAWTQRPGETVQLDRWRVDRGGLVGMLAALRVGLERYDDAATQPALASLYASLVEPVRHRLGERGTALVLSADEALGAVPFAALRDQKGQYLMEMHRLRIAGPGGPPAPRGSVDAGTLPALFVADPAADPRVTPEFRSLPGASDEVRSAAAGYSRARVLAGAAATGDSVLAGVRRASVFHFAGHAVLDDIRPEESFLVVAAAPGASEDEHRVTAAALGRENLRHVRLVVLSACNSARPGEGSTAGFAGLTGALLGAGARGVVGSLWPVEDQSTRALMVAFHEAYRTNGGDGAAALRAAQLTLRDSSDASLASPSAWAAFQYVGR